MAYTGQLAGPISALSNSINIAVKKQGRVRPPNLPDAQLKAIGDVMVKAQKDRWAKHYNAQGVEAQKLTVRYAIIKQAVLHKRAYRDMSMTGKTIKNFTLRKAAEGKIRAENTTKLERDKARRANNADQMIGFSMLDTMIISLATQKEFGSWVQRAWIPLDGTNRRPNLYIKP